LEGAEAVAAYTRGMLDGRPALTRHAFGAGHGWYLSTALDPTDYAALVGRLLDDVGIVPGWPTGVEAVTRGEWLFLLNHRDDTVTLPRPAHDLLTDRTVAELPPGGCAVLRAEPHPAREGV
ncbi:beta-galactosidase trimerization domain-containing protein, partial [Actinosynnema sp. NPDC023658]|uniref:beta-galactosidase trimerization domain-containing protein n=1 Tax=Actinosynnema sp. NPDC023658 TaxID=3155465 RepID=UPI0033E5DACC